MTVYSSCVLVVHCILAVYWWYSDCILAVYWGTVTVYSAVYWWYSDCVF